MFLKQARLIVMILLFLAAGSSAVAGQYADPAGFSFTHPDDWTPVHRAAMGDVNKNFSPEIKNWIAQNNLDLNRTRVVLIRNVPDDFLANLNVVVEAEEILVTQKTVAELTKGLPKEFAAIGVKITNFQAQIRKVCARDAIVSEYDAQMPGFPHPLRQRQYYVPGGGKTFTVSCTAKAASFDQYVPTFEGILASFNVPAPTAPGFIWKGAITAAIIGAVGGGVTVAVIVVVKKFAGTAGPSGLPRNKLPDE